MKKVDNLVPVIELFGFSDGAVVGFGQMYVLKTTRMITFDEYNNLLKVLKTGNKKLLVDSTLDLVKEYKHLKKFEEWLKFDFDDTAVALTIKGGEAELGKLKSFEVFYDEHINSALQGHLRFCNTAYELKLDVEIQDLESLSGFKIKFGKLDIQHKLDTGYISIYLIDEDRLKLQDNVLLNLVSYLDFLK